MVNQRQILEAMMNIPASSATATKNTGSVNNIEGHMEVMRALIFGKPMDPKSTDLTGAGVEVLLGKTPKHNPVEPVKESIESVLLGRRFDESLPFATAGEMKELNLRISQTTDKERVDLEALRDFYEKSNKEVLAAHTAEKKVLAAQDETALVWVPGQGKATSTAEIHKAQRRNQAYDDFINSLPENHDLRGAATVAKNQGIDIEEFLNTPYGGAGKFVKNENQTIIQRITGEAAYDYVPPQTIRDFDGSKKSNRTKSNGGSNQVSSEKAGYEGFQSGGLAMNFIERHGAGAMIGAGAGMISEGEVSAGGAARGAMFGVMGGKAARMVTGSMKGGSVNALGKSLGSKIGGMGAEGGAANKAGQYLQETMEGFAGSKSQEAFRMATFAGAGLAGFSMGRDRSHSRGLNSGRGNGF